MKKIKELIKGIHRHCYKVAYNLYVLLFTWESTIQGTLSGEPKAIKVLLLMDRNGRTERDLLRRMFDDRWERLSSRRVCFLGIRKLGRHLPPGVDLCVVEVPHLWDRFMAGAFELHLPEFVRQTLDLSGGLAAVKNRIQSSRRRSTFNKILREKKFSFRVAEGEQDIENFYYNMYLPHVREQFGSAAWVSTLDRMKSHADARIFYISDGEKDVAAELITIRDGTLFRFNNGVLSGQSSEGWSDAGNALYALAIAYALEMGLDKMDMGLSRPFLNDGVYLYKRSWGAGVEVDPLANVSLYLAAPTHSEGARQFLSNTPLAVFADHGMRACCHEAQRDVDEAEIQQLVKACQSPGLTGLRVHLADGKTVREVDF